MLEIAPHYYKQKDLEDSKTKKMPKQNLKHNSRQKKESRKKKYIIESCILLLLRHGITYLCHIFQWQTATVAHAVTVATPKKVTTAVSPLVRQYLKINNNNNKILTLDLQLHAEMEFFHLEELFVSQ